jgi:hypothetical protein
MLESSFINCCPVCNLESTKDKKWYKIKYNKQVLVPINTKEVVFNLKSKTKFKKCCNTCDELFRITIILYKYLILIVGCLMINYVIGLALLYILTDADQEEKSVLYLIVVPNVVGLVFFIITGICFKMCCTCQHNDY